MADCISEKNKKGRKKNWNKASEVSISTEIDLLITNKVIFIQYEALFLFKMAETPKLRCGAAQSERVEFKEAESLPIVPQAR